MTRRAAPASDEQRAKDTLLWARKQRIAVSEISIGAVHLVLADLGLGGEKKPGRGRGSIYDDYGGGPLAEAVSDEPATSTYEDDDEP